MRYATFNEAIVRWYVVVPSANGWFGWCTRGRGQTVPAGRMVCDMTWMLEDGHLIVKLDICNVAETRIPSHFNHSSSLQNRFQIIPPGLISHILQI